MKLPKYQYRKTVRALKIARFDLDDNGIWWVIPAEEDYSSFGVSQEYMDKHSPHVGGYYVVYEDGYKSYSPADAFEAGYTKL